MFLILKLVVQKVISLFPQWFFRLNEFISVVFFRSKNKLSASFFDNEIARSSAVAKDLVQLSPSKRLDFEILEIGTGWHGSDLIVFYLLGCPHVSTIDVHPFLKDSTFSTYITKTGDCLGVISEISDVDIDLISERYSNISECKSFSDFSNITGYKYFAPENLSTLKSVKKYDLFYSYSVLHRLKVEDLKFALSQSLRHMKPTHFAYHVIHHYDLHARLFKSLSPLYYLKFEKAFWEFLQSEYLNYQNRLRSCEFFSIFENLGYSIDDLSTTSLDDALYLPSQLSDYYKRFDKSDILTGRSKFFLSHSK